PLSNVINITSNAATVFGNAIASDLMGTKWQMVVEGKGISKTMASDIEQFIKDNFAQADEWLLESEGMSSLEAWLANHVCVRSLIGVQWISEVVNGKYILTCIPRDMRWTPFRHGKNGLDWVAPITWKSREDIAELFPNFAITGGSATPTNEKTSGSEFEVRDYWDGKKNETWVAKGEAGRQDHKLGRPPFVIVSPSAGFMLRDRGWLEHDAEDLFYLNKGVWDEENRTLSVDQTFAFRQLYPAYEYEQETFDSKPSDPAPKTGESLKRRKGELHKPVELGDMNRASQLSRQDIKQMREIGSISDAELGTTFGDRPGVWFTRQFEIRQKFLAARLEAIQMMKQGLARLMIEQFVNSRNEKGKDIKEVSIGRRGSKNQFSASKLGDPDTYTITARFMVSSKTQEFMNMTQAAAAKSIGMPQEIIDRDILKVENPAEMRRLRDIEQARQADPVIGLYEMARSYAEEAQGMADEGEADKKRIISMQLTDDMVNIMKARQQPQPPAPGSEVRQPEEPKGDGRAVDRLLGPQGGGAGAAPREGVLP
ncbi:hypothetical protein LCGC14_1153460, partial [marine sediment metagenome]